MKRNLLPGSEWLYFKIYTGVKSADKIVTELIKPFAEQLQTEGLITEFFFIRYNDPKFHLRVRLRLTNENCFNGILKFFNKSFERAVENQLIHKIQFDIYNREIERYGEATIEATEELFCADSISQIALIEAMRDEGDSDRERWLMAMVLVDDFLNLSGYDLEGKEKMISRISNSFKEEFGINSLKLEQPLNDKYRVHRKQIEETLACQGIFLKYKTLIENRNRLLNSKIKSLKESCETFEQDFEATLPSLLHMMMNRLFRSNNRMCETVIYYLLNKYYTSQIAQQKYRKKE